MCQQAAFVRGGRQRIRHAHVYPVQARYRPIHDLDVAIYGVHSVQVRALFSYHDRPGQELTKCLLAGSVFTSDLPSSTDFRFCSSTTRSSVSRTGSSPSSVSFKLVSCVLSVCIGSALLTLYPLSALQRECSCKSLRISIDPSSTSLFTDGLVPFPFASAPGVFAQIQPKFIHSRMLFEAREGPSKMFHWCVPPKLFPTLLSCDLI